MIERPLILIGLILILPIALIWWMRFIHGKEDLRALGGQWRFNTLWDVYLFKSFFSFVFFILFYTFAVFALAGFCWGEELKEEKRKGREVVFLLDISNSMRASDLEPSRLIWSARVIQSVVDNLNQARFALVAFKGDAVTLMPMTEDIYALHTILKHINTSIITTPGSNLQNGIEASLEVFSESNRYRAVVLLSDGEYQGGNPASAAAKAGKLGIPIFVAAAGTERGGSIYISADKQIMDEKGNPVISKVRLDPLKKIARLSGGQFFYLKNPIRTGIEITGALEELEEGELTSGFRRVKKQRYRLFVCLSLLFLSLFLLVRTVRWRKIF